MTYLIGIIAALVLGYLYQTSRRKDAEAQSLIANTKGQDKQLEIQANDIKRAISEIDSRLEEIKKQREEQLKIEDKMTLAEREEKANKKFGKE